MLGWHRISQRIIERIVNQWVTFWLKIKLRDSVQSGYKLIFWTGDKTTSVKAECRILNY